MSKADDFLRQLKKELKIGDKTQLTANAWSWFEALALPADQEAAVRRKLVKLLGDPNPLATPTPRFTHLLDRSSYPDEGWLRDYLNYTTFCAAPLSFHFFVGLAILGSALRRDAWIPFGRNNTFGALYVVLVAPPGVCYKSTAINIGVDLLRESELVTVIAGRATPEGLSDILSTTPEEAPKDAIAMICASELYRFLAGHNTPANNQIVSALTSWYDAQDVDDDITITRKQRLLHNIAISLLGGTTLEWLVESLPKHVFAGGFMSRIIFVAQEYTDRVMSISPPDDPLLRLKLLEDLQEIKEAFKGPKEFTIEAFSVYDKWFHKQHVTLRESEERIADFYQRRADHVRKIALILAANGKRDAIGPEDVSGAIRTLEMLDPALNSIITPISLGEQGHDLDLIRRTLERYDEMSRTELVRRMSARGIDAGKLTTLLDTLKQAGLAEEVKSGKKGGRMYRWIR